MTATMTRRRRIQLTCTWCGAAFETRPSEAKKYCRRQCYFADAAHQRSLQQPRRCVIDGCDGHHKAKGLCERHYNLEYYRRDPDRHRARAREWAQKNPEKARAAQRDYYMANAEQLRDRSRTYYRKHRLRYIANAANQRAQRLGVAGRLTAEGVAARLQYFANRCWVCGAEDADTIDHVIALGRGGPNVHANIRPACAGCNFGKTWEGRRDSA